MSQEMMGQYKNQGIVEDWLQIAETCTSSKSEGTVCYGFKEIYKEQALSWKKW